MNIDLTKRWITRWESKRAVAYDDATGEPIRPGVKPLGNPTVAVGLNLLTGAARMQIATLGLDYGRVLAGEIALDDQQIDYILSTSITSAVKTARSLLPTFDYIPDEKQLVLTDLAFNMGEARLSEFSFMLSYARMQHWANAAAELANSKWFHQVGAQPHERGGADVAVLGGTAKPEEILGS